MESVKHTLALKKEHTFAILEDPGWIFGAKKGDAKFDPRKRSILGLRDAAVGGPPRIDLHRSLYL